MSGSSAQDRMAQAQAQNNMARQAVLGMGQPMTQRVYSNTYNPSTSPVLNISPRNVGLIRGFYVQLAGTFTNPAGAIPVATTRMNLSNLLARIQFTDLSNYIRINTAGWHLAMIDSVKTRADVSRSRPYGSAYMCDDPRGFGSNTPLHIVPQNIAAGASAPFSTWFYVPLSYSDTDLRGAVYAAVINATMNLQLTLNTANLAAPLGQDGTLAVFQGQAAGVPTLAMSAVTVNVYQDFIDQLPMGNGGAVLPLIDLARIYELKDSALTGLSVGQDFPLTYPNFRDILSTSVIFDNGGTTNPGTDINYLSLQGANFTNLFQVPPQMFSLWTRQKIGLDVPVGMYYLDSRKKPISTVQYGNMEFIVNPSVVNVGAQLLYGLESMGTINSMLPAGSLAAG